MGQLSKLVTGFAICVLFATGAQARTGLSKGNTFTLANIQGWLIVHCPLGPGSAHFVCEKDLFSPSSQDYFVSEPGGKASTVRLTATDEKGKKTVKSLPYDAGKGRSWLQFTLWDGKLWDPPLLKVGQNQVTWELLADGTVERAGQFAVEVIHNPDRNCPLDSVESQNPADCEKPGWVCSNYFKDHNYCQ